MDNKESAIELDPNRFKDLDYLKETAEEFDPFCFDQDIDVVYHYARMLYFGTPEVEQDKDKANEIFAKIFVQLNQEGFSYGDWNIKEWEEGGCCNNLAKKYKDIFLAVDYFTEEGIGPNEYLIEIAKIIQKGVKGILDADPKRAFELAQNMPYPYGLTGGFELVDMIRVQDLQKVFLGDCYMNGLGTKQNFQKALAYYLYCHMDHLAQKHLDCPLTGQFEALYGKLEDALLSDDSSKAAMYNYVSIAKMTMEGLGCTASPSVAKEYLDLAENLAAKHGESLGRELDIIDNEYLERLIGYNAKPYQDGMKLAVGDHVILGKYNNRSVFWKVIDVSDGKALLLSDDVLESSYILGARAVEGDWASNWTLNNLVDMDYKEDEETGFTFLLSKELVEKYLPSQDSRKCYYRDQALRNTTDEDECGNSMLAPWWLLSSEDYENTVRSYVDEMGIIDEGNYHYDTGIRPAMFVRAA